MNLSCIKRRYKFLALVALVALALKIFGGGSNIEIKSERNEIMKVGVLNSKAECHATKVRLDGVVKFDTVIDLMMLSSGRISKINFAQGALVKKDDVILCVENNVQESQLRTARVEMEQKQLEYDVASHLDKSDNSSKSRMLAAKKNLALASQGLVIAEKALDDTCIKSPENGIVNDIKVEVGDFISSASNKIVTFVGNNGVVAISEISEKDVQHIHNGSKVSVNFLDQEMRGNVRFISRLSGQNRSYRVESLLDCDIEEIHNDMSASIVIYGDEMKAHFLDFSILNIDQDGKLGVKVAKQKDGKYFAEFVMVEITDTNKNGIWVIGLSSEECIINKGHGLVKSGSEISLSTRK